MNAKSLVIVAAMVIGSFPMSANAGQGYTIGRTGFVVVTSPRGPGILDKWFPPKSQVRVACKGEKGVGLCAGHACCSSVRVVSAGKSPVVTKVQFCKSKCPMADVDKKPCCKGKPSSR